MLDYSLCNQTVTVYRMGHKGLERIVVDGCHYVWEDHLTPEIAGGQPERKFLLIMPGSMLRVFVGDRIFNGEGPEEVDWQTFLPVNVPGLSIAAYTKACWWGGDICHIEAGRK